MQRVVITGLGCLTSLGLTPDALWQALETGQSGIAPYVPEDAVPDPLLRFKNIAQIADFDTSSFSQTQLATSERCSQFAILAARQAAAQSSVATHHDPSRIAVILGCSTNGRHVEEPETARVYRENARVHPLSIPRSMASNGVSQVTADLGVTGPAFTVSTACASGAHAIGLAFHMVRSGMVSAALAGAHEAPFTRTFLRAWDSMRVVSPTQCRPFSTDRDGMTLGEGAAVLALETLASARARGTLIFAEILGFGMSADAHHMTQPKPEGPAQAIRAALDDAAQTLHRTDQPGDAESLREQIAYINAHGTGTQANDAAESAALHAVFGPRAAHIPVSATKGFHGHALGASSAIETLITAFALHHRRMPCTANTQTCDPALNLNLILNKPQPIANDRPAIALSSSLAFGGLNAVLCLRSVT